MRKQIERIVLVVVLIAAFAVGHAVAATPEAWKPTRPVTMYLYSGAGGDTDTAGRALAAFWQDYFGVPVNVINMPGGGGGIAANQVYGQPADGHTLFGMAEGVNSMNVMGAFEHKTDVWDYLIMFGGKGCIGVRKDSPYQTIEEVVEAAKTKNIRISCSSAGSIWHVKALQFARGTETKFNILPYDGSNQAVIGLLSGETEVIISSIGEQREYLLGGHVRALATIEVEPGTLEDYGDIPSIADSFPAFRDMPTARQWNGIGMRADTPDAIKAAYQEAFRAALQSTNLKSLESLRSTTLLGLIGDDADKLINVNDSCIAWILYDEGIAKASPEKYDIPRP